MNINLYWANMSRRVSARSFEQPLEDPAPAAALASQSASGADKSSSAGPKQSWVTKLTQRFPILRKKRGIALVVGVPLVLLSGLAGLAALPGNSSNQGHGPDRDSIIRDDAEFYGRSPPVYPSRKNSMLSRCWKVARSNL